MTTPRLGAPELVSGQATPETTVNEQIRYLESGAGHFIFKDRDLATPPGSPADGDCYLVAGSPTGAWTGHAGDIAFRVNTAWAFIEVIEGFTAWVSDENLFLGYDGAAWNTLAAPSGVYLPLTGGTLSGDLVVPDEAYDATGWNGNNEAPTKNAVRDKIEDILDGVTFTGDIVVPDEAYDATTWNGSLEVPTKNAVRDKIEAIVAGGSYTDEMAQDAIGAMIDSSLTYTDATPLLQVNQANLKPTEHIQIACSDESTAITTGTAKVTFRMPYAFTLTDVRASVNTAPTGSTIIIDINEGGATILSTKLSIDASEKTSTTAASAAVISDASLADDAEMTIDFDQVGSTIAGKGVKVILIGHRT